jgi:hypothetical protein
VGEREGRCEETVTLVPCPRHQQSAFSHLRRQSHRVSH